MKRYYSRRFSVTKTSTVDVTASGTANPQAETAPWPPGWLPASPPRLPETPSAASKDPEAEFQPSSAKGNRCARWRKVVAASGYAEAQSLEAEHKSRPGPMKRHPLLLSWFVFVILAIIAAEFAMPPSGLSPSAAASRPALAWSP